MVYDYGDYKSEDQIGGQALVILEFSETKKMNFRLGRVNELTGSGSTIEYETGLELIDSNGHFRLSIPESEEYIDKAVFVQVEAEYMLNRITLNPVEVDGDLLLSEFSPEAQLVYCFFYRGRKGFTIRAEKRRDTTMRQKLLQSPRDVAVRQIMFSRCKLDFQCELMKSKQFLTYDEVASILDINKGTLQNKVSSGNFLQPHDAGGTKVFDKDELLDWIRKQ